MFEEELELEKKNSSLIPMLLVGAVLCAIGYGIYYFITDTARKLSVEQATPLAQAVVKQMKPPVLDFHTGTVVYGMKENPSDPHFKLLAKAGLVTVKPVGDPRLKINVTLTDKGKQLIESIPGVQKKDDKENTVEYMVPLADHTFDKVSKVTMQGTTHAVVDYSWTWSPNELGKLLDADGELVKSFGVWERQTLIDKYGAKFYTSAGPQSTKLAAEFDHGKGAWKIQGQ